MLFDERFRAVNDIADHFGYLSGYPNFHEADYPLTGRVFGTVLISEQTADVLEVSAADMNHPPSGDIEERFRQAHNVAIARGYGAGFPNFHEADRGGDVEYGVVALSPSFCLVQNVSARKLGHPTTIEGRFTSTHDWAVAHGYIGGYPSFHEANRRTGVEYGTVLLLPGIGVHQDIPVSALQAQQPFSRFIPSVHGFAFTNSWPNAPLVKVDLGITKLPIGNASAGLCGGMVFAALDYFLAHRDLPSPPRPNPGTALFDYLVDRFIESFDLPMGPLRYLDYMNPARRDQDTHFARLFGIRGRDHQMLRVEWPRLRARLDNGEQVPVAWVHARSANPADLGKNHVVLAYRYEYEGPLVRVWVYNPNVSRSQADKQWFSFRGDSTAALDHVHRNGGGAKIVCFFPLDYEPSDPPL